MHRYLWVLCVACSSAPTEPAPDGAAPLEPGVVETDAGLLRGVREGAVFAWRGVPYAAPPVGALRWESPQPVVPWQGIRDASTWPQACVQITTSGALIGGSEDCLYLNVWAPAEAHGLPVLVFIHGGFNLFGSATQVTQGERTFDGAYMAEHGAAIVVTLDYRLGAFGFYKKNLGIEDDVAALRWVQANIAAVGGDPAHVMVFGESAGGTATCALLASPEGHGLFSAALMESGGCSVATAERAAVLDKALEHGAGCDAAADVLACMREKPADQIAIAAGVDLTQPGSQRFTTRAGDTVVPVQPLDAITAGTHSHVPFVIGTNTNEYSTLIGHYLTQPVTTDAEYRMALARFYPQRVAAIAACYPSSPSPQQALIDVLTDSGFTCPARRIARAATATQSEPVRRYLYAHAWESGPQHALGAGHAMELPFVFHHLALTGFTASPAELALSDAMLGYWTRLAAGDPDHAGATPWPAYDATDPALVLDDVITTATGFRADLCDFWDQLSSS
jgi:para-nitrobenzyl esterase